MGDKVHLISSSVQLAKEPSGHPGHVFVAETTRLLVTLVGMKTRRLQTIGVNQRTEKDMKRDRSGSNLEEGKQAGGRMLAANLLQVCREP